MSDRPRPSAPRTPGAPLYRLYMLSLAVCLAGNLLIRLGARGGWLPSWAQAALAALAALPLAVSAVIVWRLLRRESDEMLQRIVLEGMAFAMVVYVPLAALYVNLGTAGAWSVRLDPPDALMLPALLIAVGVALAWRRYR